MSLQNDQRELAQAWDDLLYAICKATGIVWLAKRYGGGLKDKYRQAETRAEWRKP
jgi:hypothetical protein